MRRCQPFGFGPGCRVYPTGYIALGLMNHRREFILSVVALAGLATSSFSQNRSMNVSVASETDGWFDVTFPILATTPFEEGGKRLGILLRIGGDWGGTSVEWGMLIPDEWEEAKMTPPPPIQSWATSVLVGRTGGKSDALVRRLSETYKMPNGQLVARGEVDLDAVSLFADPRPIGSKPIHLKVFLHGGPGAEYGEFYLNVDLAAGQIQLKEKDPQYRRAVVTALSVRAQ
jgi:hypothetical protein